VARNYVLHRRAGGQSQFLSLLERDPNPTYPSARAYSKRNLTSKLTVKHRATRASKSASVQPCRSVPYLPIAGQGDREPSASESARLNDGAEAAISMTSSPSKRVSPIATVCARFLRAFGHPSTGVRQTLPCELAALNVELTRAKEFVTRVCLLAKNSRASAGRRQAAWIARRLAHFRASGFSLTAALRK